MPADVLAREARLLVERLRLWTPARWAARVGDSALDPQATGWLSRGDLVHHLAASYARLVDAPLALPRLDSDLALPDQLAVTADDLVRSAPSADEARAATAHLLLHRFELLGDPVPPGLAEALALPDVLAAGRAACSLWTARPP